MKVTKAQARAHPVAWAMLASHGLYLPAKHIWWLGEQLLKLFRGDITRLVVSVPPRHSKSETISKYLPTWWLGNRPRDRVIACSYGESLTRQWSEAARDILSESGHVFGVDTNTRAKATNWRVFKGGRQLGGLFGVGKGGSLTGRGADLLIIDDLVKDPDDVNTENQRNRTWQWFQTVPMTRLQPGARICCIGTRWHHDDYLGRIIRGEAGDGWTVVNLPALAVDNDPLGREPGEPLWPEFWGRGDKELGRLWYEKRKAETDAKTWSALYQGRPTPAEGAIFSKDHIRYFTEAAGVLTSPGSSCHRDSLSVYATFDLAYSKKTSADYSVGCVWGADSANGVLYLLDLFRERVGADGLEHWIRRVLHDTGARIGYVEHSGFHSDIVRYLVTGSGLPLEMIQPNKDKVSRAQPAAALMASRGLFFRSGAPWLHDMEMELLEFDQGANDDQVDAISYGVHVFNSLHRSSRVESYEVDSSWSGSGGDWIKRGRSSWL